MIQKKSTSNLRTDINLLLLGLLSEEEKMYTNTILNNMGDSVFIKDDQSRLLLVNDAFCEMFSLPRSEIIGRTLAENVAPEERESFLRIDKQVLSEGIENINEESLTIKGHNRRIISTRKSRFIDKEGNRYIVGVVRDITERKKAEEDLKSREDQLRKLNSTKDKLISIIAHDIRNPINNILLLSELLNDSILDGDVAQSLKYKDLLESTSENTVLLLDNLLTWAQSQTGLINYKSEKLNVVTLVNEVLYHSEPIAKTKNITLKPCKKEIVEIYSDEKVIQTVIRNLVSNAIKFTKPDGTIEINIQAHPGLIDIIVSDNGVGMSEETRLSLFGSLLTKSTSGTAAENGSGFGLVLCKEFVEKLGGQIKVESTEGKGSDFKVTLPIGNDL